jgi:ATP-dependent exoDNAse (exonuclease V) alpha subunit
MRDQRESIRGTVDAVFYSGPTFSAGRLVTPDGKEVKFAGKVFVREHDAVRLEGRWVTHPKYGRQFEAEFLGHDLELDPEGLARFLANHPDIKGIGPAKAKLIADRFGRGFDAAIRNEPESVAAVAKAPIETIGELRRIWIANRDFNHAMAHLAAYGLTHHQVTTLVEKFGSQVVVILERDPYVLMREVPGFGFKRVDKIARKMGTPKDLPSRIRAGIQYCVLAALDDGDCWVEYEDLLDRGNTLLVMDTLDSREVIERHLEALIEEGVLVSQAFERLVVADPEIHRMETELAAVFRESRRCGPRAVTTLDALLDVEGGELTPEQREAVRNALTFLISLMTGGAGSGKTYAVSAITTIAERLEKKVVLAAPTGKAAKRLEEVVGHEASTIHRLLGFNGHSYARDALNPIEADILVVDECFDYKQPILTEDGWRCIGSIVNNEAPVRVWSRNPVTGELELKPIVRWLKRNAPKELIHLTAGRSNSQRDARSILCTCDHKILTPYGYRRAGEMLPGEEIIVRGPAFTPQQKSILIGSLLGDGCMGRRRSGHPQVVITHGQAQLEYLTFKQKAFGALSSALRQGKSGYGAKTVWRLTLATTDETYQIAREMIQSGNHGSGRRRWIPTDRFLEWVDEQALAIWYLDNGSRATRISASGSQTYFAKLHTERFGQADNLRLAGFLKARFGLVAQVAPDSRGNWFLRFSKAESGKLFDIITPFVPACMEYKIPGRGTYEYVPAIEPQTCVARVRTMERCRPSSRYVFDIEVEDHHNYVAGNIIVSNCSMVDVPLAWRLFQAVDLTKTAVVLVGDHNQLPPVGPGNLLRDLVKSRMIPTTILTRIIRQAGVLKENSTAILSGEVRPTTEVQNGARRPWYVIDRFSDREDVRRMLLLLFEEVLAERLGYDLLRDVQVLTPTHKGPLGTAELNVALQRLLQKKLRGFDVPDEAPGHRPVFYAGDKVIQTRNDYELGVMNGAVGFVLEATAKGALMVDFDGAVVEIEPGSDAASRLQLAYACSVHKVQGSEFPCAIVVAHKSHSFMHHRNLLYTAVTRAQESVILLGDRWGIENCAAKRQVDRRNTFLSFLLEPEARP